MSIVGLVVPLACCSRSKPVELVKPVKPVEPSKLHTIGKPVEVVELVKLPELMVLSRKKIGHGLV